MGAPARGEEFREIIIIKNKPPKNRRKENFWQPREESPPGAML